MALLLALLLPAAVNGMCRKAKMEALAHSQVHEPLRPAELVEQHRAEQLWHGRPQSTATSARARMMHQERATRHDGF